MAKKKAAKKTASKKSNTKAEVLSDAMPQQREPDDGKVAFLLRLEKDLHDSLKRKAEEAGISLNQLIQGLCRGTVNNLIVGEVTRSTGGYVTVNRNVRKCLGVGEEGFYLTPEQREDWDEVDDYDNQPIPAPRDRKGFLWFGLDFSDRGVVQHTQQ